MHRGNTQEALKYPTKIGNLWSNTGQERQEDPSPSRPYLGAKTHKLEILPEFLGKLHRWKPSALVRWDSRDCPYCPTGARGAGRPKRLWGKCGDMESTKLLLLLANSTS